MKKVEIYYADLTPCDDMHNYKEAVFVPKFIEEDTHLFDIEPPISIIQVATRFGWCIVAKWGNNGSTRIYAEDEDTVYEGIDILCGRCDSGDCYFTYGEEIINRRHITEEDRKVFWGHNGFDIENVL